MDHARLVGGAGMDAVWKPVRKALSSYRTEHAIHGTVLVIILLFNEPNF